MIDQGSVFIDGTINESLPNTMFKARLVDGRDVLVTIKGSLRRRYARIFPGDKVKIEMTKYDTERGRIVAKLNR